jgi:sarcosine oxidase delta subunit
MISVHFYKDLSYDCRFWFDSEDKLQIIKKLWNRIKGCCRILFTGRLTVSEEMIVMGEKHIDSIIDCFNEGKKYIADIKKEPK